jgi:hypothetical protein
MIHSHLYPHSGASRFVLSASEDVALQVCPNRGSRTPERMRAANGSGVNIVER